MTGTEIRDNMRKVTADGGTEVYPTVEGLQRAKELIAAGESIRYVGATGPLQFDENGDVQAPKMTWKLEGEENVETGYYSMEDVAALLERLDG